MRLLAVQRRDKIKAMLLEKESIAISEIMSVFHISVETARRDLDILENEGFLDKIYGGATLKKRTKVLPPKPMLTQAFANGKKRVADRAVQFMKQGDTIFLDNSSAVFYMCPGLMNLDITVLTNSLAVINTLSKSKSVKLIGVGGRYEAEEEAFLGPTAIANLKKYQVDRAFFSCKSFDMIRGAMTSNELLADMKRTAIQCAQQACMLVDHSKFDKVSFIHLCNMQEVDRLFTDEPINEEWKKFFDKSGTKVYECLEDSGEGAFPAVGELPIEADD
jgi:DeoR/GlpR family transcriptional regulator of sugar metabolism